jgi:hypothetical protein
MNLVTVDVTGIEGVESGDEVVLFGRQGGEFIGAEEFGLWAGTINYEVTPASGRGIIGFIQGRKQPVLANESEKKIFGMNIRVRP